MDVALQVSAPADVPAKLAYLWWTDYTPGDHEAAWFQLFGWERREILERDEEGRVTKFRDVGQVLGKETSYTSELTYDPPYKVHEESQSAIGAFSATYAFQDDGAGGTVVVWTIRGQVTARWARLVGRLPGLPRLLATADLRGHVHEMEEELG